MIKSMVAWKGRMKKKSYLFRQISYLFGRVRIYLDELGLIPKNSPFGQVEGLFVRMIYDFLLMN